jgi:PAS domain S-box-containing protein
MTDASPAADWHRLVFDHATAAMILIDGDGAMRSINLEAARLFGYDAAELIGQPLALLLPDAENGAEPTPVGAQARGRRRDGGELPVELRLRPLEDKARGLLLVAVFDLSGRRNEELAQRAAELESANERLARFAFVASQDLQEPLRKIAAFGDLMDEAIARGECADVIRANDVMRRSALRAHALVHDLLEYSRIVNADLELAALDLGQAIGLALAQLAEPLGETSSRVELNLPPVAIEADATQFARLVHNIVSNAIKYRKPDRPASVEISAFCDQTHVCLAIADDGIGFEAQYAQKIFEPLKRLHSSVDYPGSGVGLAICKAIVDRHGWRISVEAKPGVGATFFIVLPICRRGGTPA